MTTRNHRVRFLTNNLAAADGAVITASGAMSGFAAELAVTTKRYELWVPPGSFVIDATNDTLYINDGSNKTVTLTHGTYTYSTLAAHVQTKLNVSSTNWTVSYATTGVNAFRFRFGRSSGTALLRLSQTTAAVWDTVGFVGAVDDDVGTGQNADEIRNHTGETFEVDLGTAHAVTAFALFGVAGRLLTIPSTATVTLKASNTGNFASPDLSLTLSPARDGIIRFLDDQADTTYRYWQLKWVDRTNPAGPEAYRIAYLYLGDYVTLEARNVNTGFRPRLVDPSTVQTSENGALAFRTFTKYAAFDNLLIQYVTDDDRETLSDLFEELGVTTPFILALDPLEQISLRATEFAKLVVLTGWEPEHFRYNRFHFAFSCREVI